MTHELPLSILANILGHLDSEDRQRVLNVEHLPVLNVRLREVAPLWQRCDASLLNSRGWVTVDDFMGEERVVAGVQAEIRQLLAEGRMKLAGLTGGVTDEQVRSDHHMWINDVDVEQQPDVKSGVPPCVLSVLRRLDQMKQQVDHQFEARTQTQLTMYPGGTRGYVRHLDASKGKSERTLTFLYYANAGWQPGDGGELRVYQAHGQHVDVEPRGDRLLVFQSRQLDHEVLPPNKDRFAITYWVY